MPFWSDLWSKPKIINNSGKTLRLTLLNRQMILKPGNYVVLDERHIGKDVDLGEECDWWHVEVDSSDPSCNSGGMA